MAQDSIKMSGHNKVLSTGDLIKMDNYCAITFPNTHTALQAEKALQETGAVPFVIMPVPRVISSGCGLSVKVAPDSFRDAIEIIRNSGNTVEGVYRIDKNRNTTERLI